MAEAVEGAVHARFGAAIRRQRQHLGIDQADLARRVGVSQQTVSRWESGDNVPVRKYLLGLADVLRLSESELLVSAGIAGANTSDLHVHLAYVLQNLPGLDSTDLLALLDATWTEHRSRIARGGDVDASTVDQS